MDALTGLSSNDGNVLLFNVHLSGRPDAVPTIFPDSPDGLPDDYARTLFHGASPLTPHMRTVAREYGQEASDGSRGFILNADSTMLIAALEIGTRPSNLER
jgi:hypothetical protein